MKKVETDYPDKLTPEQKEIFDNENPYWVRYIQKKRLNKEI